MTVNVNIAEASVGFGATPLGTPVTQNVTVHNTSASEDATVTITGDDASSFTFPSAYATIPFGNSVTFQVTFEPSRAGAHSATLTAATQNEGSDSAALSGTGVPVEQGEVTSDDDDDDDEDTSTASERIDANDDSSETNRYYKVYVPKPETTLNLGHPHDLRYIKVQGFGIDTVKDGYLNACGKVGIQADKELYIQSVTKSVQSTALGDQVIAAGGSAYLLGQGGVLIATSGADPVGNDDDLMPTGGDAIDDAKAVSAATTVFTAFDAVVAGTSIVKAGYEMKKSPDSPSWKDFGGVVAALGGCVTSSLGFLAGVSSSMASAAPPGVSVYGHTGVLLATPMFGGFYAGAGMVLGSLYPLLLGCVDAEVLGIRNATVTSMKGAATLHGWKNAAVVSEGEVSISANSAAMTASKTFSETKYKENEIGTVANSVTIEGRDEVRIVVGNYLVHVKESGSIFVGTRTGEDANAATIDETMPRVEITDDSIALRNGKQDKGSTLVLKKDQVLLFEGPTKSKNDRAQLQLEKGASKLWGGKDAAFIAENNKLTFQAPNVKTKKVQTIELKVGSKIKLA